MTKVAGYCRVSTLKEDQTNSFEAQQRYFREMISRREDWELYEIYADEGISGTSIQNRTQFHRMLQDAKKGKFQLILTKEISRFSRNVKDTLQYTRELKSCGVGVIFENEHINTLDSESELYLSILGSIAQEESRNISNRVKWGQTRQMERGIVFGRSFLGYDVEDGKLKIEPDGAKLVRSIFYRYGVEKKSASAIAKELQREGCRTYTGNAVWSANQIVRILKNEKYAGDLIQKKTYTPDYLTHQKKVNRGAEKQILLKHHHEPIISRTLWDTVQCELEKRSRKNSSRHSDRYPFSGKLRCGECGSMFVAKKIVQKNGSVCRWRCYTAATKGRTHIDSNGNNMGCDVGKVLRNDTVAAMLRESLCRLPLEREKIAEKIAMLAAEAIFAGQKKDTCEHLQYEIERLCTKHERMMESYFSGDISRQEMKQYQKRYEEEKTVLFQRLETARSQETSEKNRNAVREKIRKEALALLNGEVESENLYRELLDYAVVYRDGRVVLRFCHLPQEFLFVQRNNCSVLHC